MQLGNLTRCQGGWQALFVAVEKTYLSCNWVGWLHEGPHLQNIAFIGRLSTF